MITLRSTDSQFLLCCIKGEGHGAYANSGKWEVPVPEVRRSVFVIPPDAFKSKRPHVVILNDVAWSIVQAQRGTHPIWVFPYRGRPVRSMSNTAWQSARQRIGMRAARIHDLRHTY